MAKYKIIPFLYLPFLSIAIMLSCNSTIVHFSAFLCCQLFSVPVSCVPSFVFLFDIFSVVLRRVRICFFYDVFFALSISILFSSFLPCLLSFFLVLAFSLRHCCWLSPFLPLPSSFSLLPSSFRPFALSPFRPFPFPLSLFSSSSFFGDLGFGNLK